MRSTWVLRLRTWLDGYLSFYKYHVRFLSQNIYIYILFYPERASQQNDFFSWDYITTYVPNYGIAEMQNISDSFADAFD